MSPGRATRNPSERDSGIQALRGVAALLVVLHHGLERLAGAGLATIPDGVIRFGAAGVDIFFVISGYVIALTAFGRGERPGAGTFLAGRIRRVMPLYWAATAAMLALMATGLAPPVPSPTPQRIAASVLLLPYPGFIVHVAWTLMFEMYFYGIVALALALGGPRERAALLVPAAILGALLLGQEAGPGVLADFVANPLSLEFLFGFGLSGLLRAGFTIPAGPAWLGAGVLLLAAASALAPSVDTTSLADHVRFLAWGVPALMIVAGVAGEPSRAGALRRALVPLGDASYALYLSHVFVMLAFAALLRAATREGWTSPGLAWGLGLLAVAASLAVGFWVHWRVETPLAGLARRFGRGKSLVNPVRAVPVQPGPAS